MNMRIYLHFNSSVGTNTHDILFHDKDPLNGHFEPLVHRPDSIMDCTFQQQSNTSYEQMNLSSKQDNIETCLLRSKEDTSEIKISHVEAETSDAAIVTNTENIMMFHSAHSSNNNNETQPETKCQFVETKLKPSCDLNKYKRSLSLCVLKEIARKILKNKKVGLE